MAFWPSPRLQWMITKFSSATKILSNTHTVKLNIALIASDPFYTLLNALASIDSHIKERTYYTGRKKLPTFQKVSAAMGKVAYGCLVDSHHESLRLDWNIAQVCLFRFCKAIVATFESTYLRAQKDIKTKHVLRWPKVLRFLEMSGSIDFRKRLWKNCSTAYHGHYKWKVGTYDYYGNYM